MLCTSIAMHIEEYRHISKKACTDTCIHTGAKPMEVLWSEGNRDGVAFFAAADIVQNLEPSMSLLESLPCQAVIATAPAPVGGWVDVVVACTHALKRAHARSHTYVRTHTVRVLVCVWYVWMHVHRHTSTHGHT